MDDSKGSMGIFARIMAIPMLALLLGAGILAGRIAMDWEPRQTDSLIGGGLAICGAGLAIFAVVTGLLVGMALYRRMLLDREQSRPAAPPPGYSIQPGYPGLPYREPAPPMIEAGRQGSWASNGPASYDLWPEEQPLEQGWSQGRQGWS